MSDIKDKALEELEKTAATEQLKAETAAKRAILDSKIVSSKLEQVEQNERDLELAKKAQYGALSKEQVEKIVKENDDYMEAAMTPIPFITETFDGAVPFFRKNFILIGAHTGSGKSTAVANIAYNCFKKKRADGKVRRVLVITNEERAEDFYNRITALYKGWHYTNHSEFTEEQRAEFRRMIPILASGGRLTVIDNNHGGSHGVTTSIEGIQGIFEALIENKEWYDVVIIDYYQNIIASKKNPYMNEYEVQARLTRMMDQFKNIYPAPIVMMAQITPQGEKDDVPFQYRIKGRKIIMDATTFACEMVADREHLMTHWIVHKSRFTSVVGQKFKTGYDKGRFVPYTTAFAEQVQRMALDRKARQLGMIIDQNNGLPDVFEKKEEKKEDSNGN